ncbi:MAG: prepilin peptidase [Fervidobacterium sp.]|uniref:prepilin peptidase n=1 Tax=Fervidobacterium sp. TaxID=1871331 RepID=UPI0040499B12
MWDKVTMIFWFALGTVFGSFANVLIYRPIAGLKISEPRFSMCPVCKKRIAWYDNIPLLSYIILRGRCRSCGSKISLRYPIIELVFGIVFLLNHIIFPLDIAICFDLLFLANLPAIFTDLKLMLLPDYTWIVTLGVGIYLNVRYFRSFILLDLMGGVLALSILLFLRWRYKGGIGEGDIFLFPVYSFAVGFVFMPFLMFISSISGLLFSKFRKSRVIPFGPFIIATGYLFLMIRLINNIIGNF